MMARKLFLPVFAIALLAAFGCGGGDGGGGTTTPTIACSDGGAAAADSITMTCGGATNATTEQINVVIGGPATGTTSLRGLNYDVTYDPSKVTFVSAEDAGPFSAGALLAATAFPLDPTPHVVVSIQQVGGDPDVVVNAGQQLVLMHLSFVVTSGVTAVAPTPVDFDVANSETTPPTTGVGFGSSLMLSY